MKIIIEPNPHRGWTSDMINRMLREKIKSGEIDPNDLKIKHKTKMGEKENGNKM